MAWYRNYYWCARCSRVWSDDWSCMCDDDCPHCGARHMSPFASDDLTEIVVPRGECFVVLRSPDTAEHDPSYEEVAEYGIDTNIDAPPTVPI
jgi:predicted  nucleic acid-binding Zn-ribbon protein